MSGAETARHRVVQRRISGAETAALKWPSPLPLSNQETEIFSSSLRQLAEEEVTNLMLIKTHVSLCYISGGVQDVTMGSYFLM